MGAENENQKKKKKLTELLNPQFICNVYCRIFIKNFAEAVNISALFGNASLASAPHFMQENTFRGSEKRKNGQSPGHEPKSFIQS